MRKFIIREQSSIPDIIKSVTALCSELIANKALDITVKYAESQRTIDQNAKLHCIISDISKQVEWHGQKLPIVTWKRLCMAAWLREEGEQPQLIPALDGTGFDVIFERTSKLGVKKCASLIEWCYAFGAERDVKWNDPIPDEYRTSTPEPLTLSDQARELCQDSRFGPWFKRQYWASFEALVANFEQREWNKLSYPEKCIEAVIWSCSIQDLADLDRDEIGIKAFKEIIAEPFAEIYTV